MAAAAPPEPTDLALSKNARFTRRLILFGYVSPFALYVAPMGLRAFVGAITLRYFVWDFFLTALSMTLIYSCLLSAHRWSSMRGHSLVRTAATSFATCVVSVGVAASIRHALRMGWPDVIPPDPSCDPTSSPLLFLIGSAFTDSIFVMLLWGGIFLLPMTYLRAQRQQIETAVARREAEVLRLRAHLEPHFLLNTLNTISGLVVDDPHEARRLIGLLGDLFRDATSDRDEDLHSLANEIGWLERYAAIHESRHRKMVHFAWDVDPGAKEAAVPRLVLQPIVENAVLHGILRHRRGGVVTVRARVEENSLVCEVEDDGPGFPEGPRRSGARGLLIVEKRLALFSPQAELTTAREGSITRVTARLPMREVAA